MSGLSEEEILKHIDDIINATYITATLKDIDGDIIEEGFVNQEAIQGLLDLYNKEKEKNTDAYRKANNYLYFADSADYEVALWEVIRSLRIDLAKKWDNGECAELEYIEEE